MLVIHCLPLQSFSGKAQFDVLALTDVEPLNPRDPNSGNSSRMRINFEGQISISTKSDDSSGYTQVFRHGAIEAVAVGILNSSKEPRRIPSHAYENCVVTYLTQCFEILERLGCSPPVFVGISLVGVRGLKMAVSGEDLMYKSDSGAIEKDVLVLPEIVVESPTAAWGSLLKPTLDLVWNACGYAESKWFDSSGQWVGRTR